MPSFVASPSPLPARPWHGAQLIWKFMRPRCSDAESAGTGLASVDIESMTFGSTPYDTTHAGINVPFVETDPLGLPRNPFVSAESGLKTCHGPTDGCCLKSESQLPVPHAPSTSGSAASA